MAINFPSNPTNAQEVTEGNVTYVYNATKGYWESSEVSSGGASIDVLADMTALIAKTGMSNGDQAFVTGNNNLYIYSGSGWYKIATVQNDSPSAITGVNGTYSLAIDGTPTVITAVSTDPEGFPLTWSYSTSGLESIATVSQVDNVFTITPSTDDANFGTFTLTINATDGVNGAVSANTSISLEFQILNSNYTTLLATATGTSDNNNITDASSNSHSITVTGDAHAGTFSPYRNGGYSTYFDGSGDKLTLGGSALSDFNFGTNSFSIEFWFYPTGAQGPIFNTHRVDVATGYYLSTTGTNQFVFGRYVDGGYGDSWSTVNAYTLNEWHHVSLNRDANNGNSLKLYVNGSLVLTTTDSANYDSYSYGPYIGGYDAGGTQYNVEGYISDLIVANGSVLRTGGTSLGDVAFSTPTEAFESDANTVLFISSSLPYIKDSSSNSHDITVTGDVSIIPFTPYDYLEYNPNVHGGSVYFDGTGDYLTVGSNIHNSIGTGDFTVEAWIYLDEAIGSVRGIFGSGPNDADDQFMLALLSSGVFYFDFGGSQDYFQTTAVIDEKVWNHIALTRSGTSFNIWLNGTSILSTSLSTSIGGASNFTVGTARVGDYVWKGYISDLRVVTGSAVYTAEFTPPTAPLSSSGSSLHIKGTDASIIDKSQSSNLKVFGNTTGSTTQVKFTDSKSMYFAGTGDYLETSSTSLGNFNFGTGDFTVECFLRNVHQPSTYFDILGTANNAAYVGSNRGGWMLSYYTSQHLKFNYQYNNTWIFENSFAQTLNINTWYHIAVTRQGTQLKCFLDGNQVGSTITDSTNIISTEPFNIARGYGGVVYTTGYIQDVRITKGLARYTANFTPPTEPLKG